MGSKTPSNTTHAWVGNTVRTHSQTPQSAGPFGSSGVQEPLPPPPPLLPWVGAVSHTHIRGELHGTFATVGPGYNSGNLGTIRVQSGSNPGNPGTIWVQSGQSGCNPGAIWVQSGYNLGTIQVQSTTGCSTLLHPAPIQGPGSSVHPGAGIRWTRWSQIQRPGT